MKKLHIFICLLAVSIFATAQSPANRTNKTIVADVLAQLPASNQDIYNQQFADLATTGEEGVLMLVDLLDGSEESSKVLASYALGGLANYISNVKDESLRSDIINAYLKAHGKSTQDVNKAFLIQQLQIMGAKNLPQLPAAYQSASTPTTPVINPVAGASNARIANLYQEYQAGKKSPEKILSSALKDSDREYRVAALNFASDYANAPMYISVIKSLKKAKPDVKTDVLRWLAREAETTSKRNILTDLEVKLEEPARNVFTGLLSDNSFEVKEASAWVLTKIGDKRSIPELAKLLLSNNNEDINLAKKTLESFRGDIDKEVAKVIPQATDAGKIAALELLAGRKADANSSVVYAQLESPSAPVKAAAYKALKDVVSDRDFVRLAGMLETASGESIEPIQQAMIASLSNLNPETQAATINKRMLQAGTSKRSLYFIPLAATGNAKALETILEGFNTEKGDAKNQAFEAILLWKGNQTADVLYNIAKDPAQSAYYEKAINALIRLVSDKSLTPENQYLGLRKAMEIAKTAEQKNTILKLIQRTNTFQGMMFAANYLDDKAVQESAAQAVMNIALNNPSYTGNTVRQLLNKVSQVLNNPDAGYQREAIRKHLNEMPDEAGYVSLFNGKDLTGWKGLVANPIKRAQMTPAQLAQAQKKADEQMRKDWFVENGCLVFDGAGYDNLCTVNQYGDIEMYIEWMLDPSGKEADAGIYLRGTPQVQIWDTARVNVGAQVGSGGLYNNQIHESKPSKVADNKMGEWNTFFIRMVGDRVTVVLNGEKVVDDVILENYWDRNLPIFAREQLELQAHGSKVFYRDIYVKELPQVEPFQLSAEEKKEGFQILFDGTNMHEWTGNTVDYTMQDGTISLVPSKGSGGNLYTKKEYGNFVFRFEFQLTPAANNGLGIRTPMEGDAAYVGMELQILDDDHPVYKDLEEYQYHGSVYGIIPAKRGALKPMGEWNYQEVIANGDHIKITLNGTVILDGNIREATKNGTLDKKEHPGLFNKKGHIAFLGHGSEVKFRNIRIKPLK